MKTPMSLAVVSMMALSAPAAEKFTPPPVGDSITSAIGAGTQPSKGLHSATIAKRVLASGQPAVITVTPILLPNIDSPNWAAAADKAIADAQAGALTTDTALASPTEYAVCDRRIAWQDLIYSVSTPMWDGMLDPASPFDQELGGPLVWQLIDARAASGLDELSLDMLSLTATSSDGNILGATVDFVGDTYTPRAIAIQADSAEITGGPASQEGVRVLVLTCTKLFNGGDTQSGISAVNTWVNQNSPYSITYIAEAGSDSTTASSATVSTSPVTPLSPVLSIMNDGQGMGAIVLSGATASAQYQILSAASVLGPWQPIGLISGNGSLPITTTDPARFYRAMAQ